MDAGESVLQDTSDSSECLLRALKDQRCGPHLGQGLQEAHHPWPARGCLLPLKRLQVSLDRHPMLLLPLPQLC
eukprot:284505-Alexandrium_andersonii.AAC.1